MSVRVTTARNSEGTPCQVEDYPGGRAFGVRDEHLHVYDDVQRDARSIAVYAPGQWSSAVTED